MNTAVLFIIFNRPDTTQKVFEAIRAARPPRLYIGADGPRPERGESEVKLCNEARHIATNVDWPCEVKTLFQKKNLGCKYGEATPMSWFFENEEEGIVLEDDTLPVLSFFQYCEELLERYRHEEYIFSISGNNFITRYYTPPYSYFFSNRLHSWGWASWRRAWKHYDVEIKDWPEWRDSGLLDKIAKDNLPYKALCKKKLNRTYQELEDTWDYQWGYTCWKMNGLIIHPKHNLVHNLGFSHPEATHTTGKADHFIIESPAKEIEFPLTHPPKIECNSFADNLIDNKVTKATYFRLLKECITSIPYVGNFLHSLYLKTKSFLEIITK